MPDQSKWPAWALVNVNNMRREDLRVYLASAQGFWRDFALAGLTLPELRLVIEERRRKGPGGRIAIPTPPKATIRRAPPLPALDNSLFDSFPPLDPDDPRWIHA